MAAQFIPIVKAITNGVSMANKFKSLSNSVPPAVYKGVKR